MNDWNTNENALLRGARSAPVGTPSGISVAWKSKFGHEPRRELDAVDVRRVREALDAALVVAEADEVVAPGDQLAGRVDAGLQEVEAAGTVVVVPHVVFTRPQQLHRHADLLRDRRRLDHVVVGEPAAEAAARAHEWTVMFSVGMPSAVDTSCRPCCGVCVGAQISILPSR